MPCGLIAAPRTKGTAPALSCGVLRPVAFAAAGIVGASLFFSTAARAQEASRGLAGEDPRLVHLEIELRSASSKALDARIAGFAGFGVTGVVLLPAGIVLSRRFGGDPWFALAVGGASAGASSLVLAFLNLRSSKMEALVDSFNARRSSGIRGDALFLSTENDWYATAIDARFARFAAGGIETGLGGALAGVGATYLLTPAGRLGVNGKTQYMIGAIGAGLSLPLLVDGLHALVRPSIEESSWRAHVDRRAVPLAAPAASLGFVPLPGGAGLGASGSF